MQNAFQQQSCGKQKRPEKPKLPSRVLIQFLTSSVLFDGDAEETTLSHY